MAPDFGQGMNPLNNMPQNTYPFYYAPKYYPSGWTYNAGNNPFCGGGCNM